jgi:FkbH-like protein
MDPLPWLRPIEEMRSALARAAAEPDPRARLAAARDLAGCRRDMLATARIDRIAAPLLEEQEVVSALGLAPLRIALLSSHTVDHLAPAIRVAALHRGLAARLHLGAYGTWRQDLLGPDPALAAFAPELILLAPDAREMVPQLPAAATAEEAARAVAAAVEALRALWQAARRRFGARLVQQTLLALDPPAFGEYEGLAPASAGALVDALNQAIRDAARQEGALLLDLARHVQWQGREGFADPVLWHRAKQLVSPAAAPVYGDLVARIAAATRGLSRKCLVLDLDNTLWGGVVGDEGIEGLRLGPGGAEGEAFAAVQRFAQQLARRGVILAVCSKNDPAIAEDAFARHPGMVLRREEIACFAASWDDKATGLRRIAKALNIGLDALAFLDDNPAERAIVRQELPMVAVPELPEDPALWPAALALAGLFEPAAFTAEDAARGASYAADAAREAALEAATDMPAYLRSLAMRLRAAPVGGAHIARVAQLMNKTNQFNLTTRRRDEAEVARLAARPDHVFLSFALTDRFGDNGLISVVLARPDEALPADEMLVDTWLMSCRVLGRGVEAAVLGVVAEAARRRGARALVGEYRPTAKNALVRDHYAALGFDAMDAPSNAAAGAGFWRFPLDGRAPPPHCMEVEAG